MLLKKIISGGQTGIDRAALDLALELGISHGGYCPKGRRSEDGMISTIYDLIELESTKYEDRTLKNVESSEGTLILHSGIISHGTALTKELCIEKCKPILIINILDDVNSSRLNFTRWLTENSIECLNVAGQRESECEIYNNAKNILRYLLSDK